MSGLPACPAFASTDSYEDGAWLACHDWSPGEAAEAAQDTRVVRDAVGNVLADGDHDIDCKIDAIGAMKLKSGFVKKE